MSEGFREFMDVLLVCGVAIGCWFAVGIFGHGWANTCIRFGIFWIRHGKATQRRHAARAETLEKMRIGLDPVLNRSKKSRAKPELVPIRKREKIEVTGK